MKICNYQTLGNSRLGILSEDASAIIDPNLALQTYYKKSGHYNNVERANHKLPHRLDLFLKVSDNPIDELKEAIDKFERLEKSGDLKRIPLSEEISFDSPLENIPSYRDFYIHEKHVAKGFEKRKEPIPEAWYEIPAYYKGSTTGFIGDGQTIPWPYYTDVLDYELELAMIIGKDGKNIKEKDALSHILGFSILNDISARDIQKKEMAVRLGPAKGKDFCSILGPVITTIDEFGFKEPNLLMQAFINGEKWSEGKSGDGHYSWAKMIAHASMEEWLVAGDVFGSGTVGTGCGLEIDKWIKPGDKIELRVEKIGSLTNIVGEKSGKL